MSVICKNDREPGQYAYGKRKDQRPADKTAGAGIILYRQKEINMRGWRLRL